MKIGAISCGDDHDMHKSKSTLNGFQLMKAQTECPSLEANAGKQMFFQFRKKGSIRLLSHFI